MTALEPEVRQRRLLVRSVLVLVYAGVIWLVFSLGKGHTLILDNKDAEDGSVKAVESLSVSVDGQDPIDLNAGDRDMAKVQGQRHRLEITVKDGQKLVRRVSVPVSEDVLLLSLPKLLAGAAAVSPFVPLDVAPPADEQQGNSNAFTSPSATPEAAPEKPAAP
jgi:hypothetical protein